MTKPVVHPDTEDELGAVPLCNGYNENGSLQSHKEYIQSKMSLLPDPNEHEPNGEQSCAEDPIN